MLGQRTPTKTQQGEANERTTTKEPVITALETVPRKGVDYGGRGEALREEVISGGVREVLGEVLGRWMDA